MVCALPEDDVCIPSSGCVKQNKINAAIFEGFREFVNGYS